MPNIPTIVLAAGASSRMAPLNASGHKSFIEIAGKPLLYRTIQDLVHASLNEIYLVISRKDISHSVITQLQDEYQTNQDVNLSIVIQKDATGMGDAVLATAQQYPKIKEAKQFAVIGSYGLYSGKAILELHDAYNQSKSQANTTDTANKANTPIHSMLVSHTDEPWRYGIVGFDSNSNAEFLNSPEFKDSSNQPNQFEHTNAITDPKKVAKIASIIEKPQEGEEPSNYKIQLAYLLENSFWNILETTESEEYSFEKALNTAITSNTVLAVESSQPLPTLKYSWDALTIAKTILHSQGQSHTHNTARVASTAILDDSSGPIVIAEQAVIGDFVKIVGPAYIGAHSFIGDYSFVRASSIESEATVGAKTEVVRSIIMKKATIHFGYVADSIIGENSKVGAGLITANKRLDRNSIKTIVKNETTATNTTQLGCIIGADAQVGIGVRTMPGILINANSEVYPGSVLTKNID